LRKTVVRIPGPSWMEKRRMSKTTPAVPIAWSRVPPVRLRREVCHDGVQDSLRAV
jgi:hypothetical protein